MPLPLNIDKLMACPDCDLLIEKVNIADGYVSECPRCHFILEHPTRSSIRNDFMCVFMGLLVYFPAIFLPFMSLTMLDETVYLSLVSCVVSLFETANGGLAVVVMFTLLCVPLLQMVLLIFITTRLHHKQKSCYLALSFKCYNLLNTWGMLDIFMLSIIVAAIKLRDDAELNAELGLYAFILLLLINALQMQLLNKPLLWRSIERHEN